MTARGAGVVVVLAILGACGDESPGGAPGDAAGDGPGDAAADVPAGTLVCAHQGTSSVFGTGPAGSLGTNHVYAGALIGFCPDLLDLRLSAADPLTTTSQGIRILAPVTPGSFGGTAEWSGTFAATLYHGPYMTQEASGTIQVHRATPLGPSSSTRGTWLAATVLFDADGWRFTAAIDGPYCFATVCI